MSKSAEHAADELQALLSSVSTEDLFAELVSREGVSHYTVKDGEPYMIRTWGENGTGIIERYLGPVDIITVVDP